MCIKRERERDYFGPDVGWPAFKLFWPISGITWQTYGSTGPYLRYKLMDLLGHI